MQKKKIIARHKNYRFVKIKQVILYIYGYRCVFCNYKSLDNHVHHIDHNHFNNDAFNLSCVCSRCHIVIHSVAMVSLPQLSESIKKQLKTLNILMSDFH